MTLLQKAKDIQIKQSLKTSRIFTSNSLDELTELVVAYIKGDINRKQMIGAVNDYSIVGAIASILKESYRNGKLDIKAIK